jgi:transposase
MARIAKKTKRYPSDLTDEEWAEIAPLIPKPGRRGRPREVESREVINAVRYLVRSGAADWRRRSTSGLGGRSTAGSTSWRGALYSRPSTTWR